MLEHPEHPLNVPLNQDLLVIWHTLDSRLFLQILTNALSILMDVTKNVPTLRDRIAVPVELVTISHQMDTHVLVCHHTNGSSVIVLKV